MKAVNSLLANLVWEEINVALPKQPVKQFSKADNRWLELTVLVYTVELSVNKGGCQAVATRLVIVHFFLQENYWKISLKKFVGTRLSS